MTGAESLLDTGEWLRPLARRLLFGDEHAAEDIIQEAWLRALAEPPRDPRALRAWLRTTVRNIAHHVRRGDRRRNAREERTARPERTESDPVERLERQQEIAAAVLALREPYRTTVLHVFYEGMSIAEIAARESTPEGTVRVQLRRALDQLRDTLDRRHGGDRSQWFAALLPFAGLPIPSPLAEQLSAHAAGKLVLGAGATSALLTTGLGTILMSSKNIGIGIALAIVLAAGAAYWLWNGTPENRSPERLARSERSSDGAAPSQSPSASTMPAESDATEVASNTPPPSSSEEDPPADLAAGGTVSGRVIGESGLPVADAEVFLWHSVLWVLEEGVLPAQSMRTAEDGTFEFESCPKDFVLAASAPDRQLRRRWHGSVLDGGTVENIELELPRSTRFAGRVVGPDGEPIEDALVTTQPYISTTQSVPSGTPGVFLAPASPQTCRSDAYGGFEFDAIAPGTQLLAVSHSSYEAWNGQIESEATPVEIRLSRGAALAGRVVDEVGEPIGGAAIQLRQAEIPFGPLYTGTSNEDGSYEIRGITVPLDCVVMARAPDHALHAEREVHLGEARTRRDIVLGPAFALAGRVVDVSGAPLAGVAVHIQGDQVLESGRGTMTPVPTWEYIFGGDTLFTDSSGEFRFDSLYDGEFKVTATGPGGDSTSRVARSGVVDLNLVLGEEPEGKITIRGTVRDSVSGEPVGDFRVSVLRPARDELSMTGRGYKFQDAGGRFEITNLDPGKIALNVDALRYSSWNGPLRDLPAGEHEVAIEVSPARTLRFRVLDGSGAPMAKSRAIFSDEQGVGLLAEVGPGMRNSMLELDEKGEGVAVGLPAARIKVSIVYPEGRAAGEFEADLRRESEEFVEYRLGTPKSHLLWAIVLSAASDPKVDFAKLAESEALREVERLTKAGDAAPIAVETNIVQGEIVHGTLTPEESGGYKYHSSGMADKSEQPVLPVVLEPETKALTFRAAGHRARTLELGEWEETLARELLVVILVRD